MDFQQNNPRRKPEWRHERICDILDRRSQLKPSDDHYVRSGKKFLARWRKSRTEKQREKLFLSSPGLFYAYQLFEESAEDPIPSLILETRVLAGFTEDQIAKGLTTIPETVSWYEKLFFDVRPYLDNRDWIVSQVLSPSLAKSFSPYRKDQPSQPFRFLDPSIKFLAYFGGPLVADTLIWGIYAIPPPESPERLGYWLDKQWSHLLKKKSQQAALLMEVNRFNVMDLMRIHIDLIEQGRADEEAARDYSYWESAIREVLSAIPLRVNDVSRSTANELPWEKRYNVSDDDLSGLPILEKADGDKPSQLS